MPTVLNMPLQQFFPETIKDLKEKFPDAQIRIEIRKKDASKILTEQRFWEIINLFDWSDSEDNERVIQPAVKELANSPVHYIYLFADMLAEKLFKLDAKIFAENIGEDSYQPNQYFSPDIFLYARCCVIGNGKKGYETVLKDPTKMPKDLTFESLLRVASMAYFQKTEKKFDYVSSIPIETYSNKSGWQKSL